MDFSFFKPYKVFQNADKSIELEETKSRKVFLFGFYRIFPLIIIFSVLSVLFFFNLPIELKLALLIIPLLFIFIFIKKYILKTVINNNDITITFNKVLGKKIISFNWSEICEIHLDSYYVSRGGGYFYYIILKENNKKIPFLSIPFFYMKEKNKNLINTFLSANTFKPIIEI